MKKKKRTSSWSIPFLISSLVTILIIAVATFVFDIPLNFFLKKESVKQEISWTPRDIESDEKPAPVVPKEEKIACTMEYAPVCGADNRDYSNACMAQAAGATVAYTGSCKDEVMPPSPGESIGIEVVSGEGNVSYYDTGSYQVYKNSSFNYELALPKFAWYQGLGARDGSQHTLAVGLSETGSEDTNADIVVYFYKDIPLSPPNGQPVIIENGRVYVIKNGSGPKIDTIYETIINSVR